jgi:hypothetical protein
LRSARANVAPGSEFFEHGTLAIQSSNAIAIQPNQRGGDLGFRPALTFP